MQGAAEVTPIMMRLYDIVRKPLPTRIYTAHDSSSMAYINPDKSGSPAADKGDDVVRRLSGSRIEVPGITSRRRLSRITASATIEPAATCIPDI